MMLVVDVEFVAFFYDSRFIVIINKSFLFQEII